MKHNVKDPYVVSINTHELKTSGRRAEIARRLLAGERKADIIDFLMKTFKMEYKQAHSEYRQGYTYIYLNTEETKEDIRKMCLARLEMLFDRAEEDEQLESKEYYKILMKNVDLTGKVAGLYEQEENTNQGKATDINFNLTLPDKN